MTIAEIIKQARENLGMTQEDLAERLEVSRQAVSKWELGVSVPSPENLRLLEEVLGVAFPPPEEDTAQASEQGSETAAPFWNWKRVVLLVLGVLIVSALLSIVMFETLRADTHTDVPRRSEPYITGVYFFDEDAAPLQPDLGDGWNSFAAGERVLVMVEFEDSPENAVNAVSLFLTPTGTETFDQREQLAVRAAGEGRSFALFAWDIPQEGLMGHLEAVLECGGGLRVTETLNVTGNDSILGSEGNTDLDDPDLVYPPEYEPRDGEVLSLSSSEIQAVMGESAQLVLEAYGAPMAEVEWSSSNPDVVRVDNNGRLSIEGTGEAHITASWNGQTAECVVRVLNKPEPSGVPGVSISRP